MDRSEDRASRSESWVYCIGVLEGLGHKETVDFLEFVRHHVEGDGRVRYAYEDGMW